MTQETTRRRRINMKHIIASAILIVGTTIGLATRASAQEDEIVVKVPFDFMVGSQTLPQGSYRITSHGEFLLFSNTERKTATFASSYHGDPTIDGSSRLKFDVVSGQHYLRAIESPSQKDAMDFPVSKAERSATELRASHDGNAVTRGR
jgi:hypothetical protein